MPRLLLLMTTTTYRASAFLDAARRLQVTVVVGSDQPQALETLTPGSTLTLDFFHPEEAARTITAFAVTYPLDAVVGVDDDTTLTAATAAEARNATVQLDLQTKQDSGGAVPSSGSRLDRALDKALAVLAWEGIVLLAVAIALAPLALAAAAVLATRRTRRRHEEDRLLATP